MKFVFKRPDELQAEMIGDENAAQTVFVPGIMGGEGSFELPYAGGTSSDSHQKEDVSKDAKRR